MDPTRSDIAKLIASVYQKTFGGDPWNEGWKCTECGTVLPLSYPEGNCPSCAQDGKSLPLAEYWPAEQIISDLCREMAKPNSICLTVQTGGEIVGFAWGYEICIDQSTDAYLDAPGLHMLTNGTYFYLDEVAILPEYQGKGIGKELVQRIFLEQSRNNILLRTINGSRMFSIIQKMEGRTALNISRDRVIMTLDLSPSPFNIKQKLHRHRRCSFNKSEFRPKIFNFQTPLPAGREN
jgi:GNAT superfamily N-acetyltransferase